MARLADHPGYRKFWVSDTISSFGTYLTSVAMPLVATFTLQVTEAQFGLITGTRYAPYLLFGLIAGVFADRHRRRPVLVGMDFGRFVLLSLLTLLIVAGWLSFWLLIVFVFVFGTMSLFYEAAHQSYLPRLVPVDALPKANARLELSSYLAQTTGPFLAGAIIRLSSVPVALFTDALSYLVSGVLLARIKVAEPAPQRTERHLINELREGLSWVYGHRILAPYAITLHLRFLFASMASVAFTLFVLHGLEPGLSAAEAGFRLGIVLAIGGVGAVVGNAVSAVAARFGVGRLVMAERTLEPLGWALAALAVSGLAGWAMVAVSQFVVWVALGLSGPHTMGYRQAVTPDRLQGRMNATIRSLNWGMLTIGAPIGGWLVQQTSYRGTLWIAIAGMMLSAIAALASPLRHARHPETSVSSLDDRLSA